MTHLSFSFPMMEKQETTSEDHEEAVDLLYKKLGQQKYDKLVQDMKSIAEKFKIRQNR